MNRRIFFSLLGATALGLAGCQKTSTDEIPVGEFASLTGKEATFGQSSHEGTQLAVEQINEAGGVLGKKIKLLTEDNASKPGESANAVNKLIATLDGKDGVMFLDIGAKFLEPDGSITRETMGDFLHPTAKGYEIWASELEPVLAKLLGEQKP